MGVEDSPKKLDQVKTKTTRTNDAADTRSGSKSEPFPQPSGEIIVEGGMTIKSRARVIDALYEFAKRIDEPEAPEQFVWINDAVERKELETGSGDQIGVDKTE